MRTLRDEQRRLRDAIRLVYLLRPDLLREAAFAVETRPRTGERFFRDKRAVYGR